MRIMGWSTTGRFTSFLGGALQVDFPILLFLKLLSFRESILDQYGRDYACLECVLEFPAEYKAVAHFSYLHAAVEEEGRLPVRFGFLSYCHVVIFTFTLFQISH